MDDGVDITINGIFITRVSFDSGNGTYSYSPATAAVSDTILLDFNNDN